MASVQLELLEEEENTRYILNAKPVKIQQNPSETVALEAIAEAAAELQEYYSKIENNNNNECKLLNTDARPMAPDQSIHFSLFFSL